MRQLAMDVIIRLVVVGLIAIGAVMMLVTAVILWALWWLGAWLFSMM